MERRYIDLMKEQYADLLLRNGDVDRAKEIAEQSVYTPILKIRNIHPEEEPNPKDINEMISDIIYDFTILNTEFGALAYEFKDLMENTKTRLNNVTRMLLIEKERQQDISIICNKYTEFSDVINLDAQDFDGTFTNEDRVFSSGILNQSNVEFEVLSIEGNGYEGNNYVYKDDKFLKDTIDTSNRNAINDSSNITVYEYSRITANSNEKDVPPLVNFDSVEAKCAIVISSQSEFNTLQIDSESKDIIISEVSISKDGVQFQPVIKKNIEFNNTDKKYYISDYIPGSGVVCFPETKYVKIVLQSNGFTDETIAFIKTSIDNLTVT